MKSRIRLFGVAALLLLVSGAVAQEGRWELLGEANVDGRADHDRISVTARDGAFRSIQLKVERAPIHFDRVIVHFHNGESEPIQIRSLIPAGGQTRVIDLPGNRRVIQNVEFFYERARRRGGRGKVLLFGMR
jgi:hypothetical protein